MTGTFAAESFQPVHDDDSFARLFAPRRFTVGVFFPIEAFQGDQLRLHDQKHLALRAETLSYSALWFQPRNFRSSTSTWGARRRRGSRRNRREYPAATHGRRTGRDGCTSVAGHPLPSRHPRL